MKVMAPSAATFCKQERMVSQKLIETLFGGDGSHSVSAFPLRVVYRVMERVEGQPPVQVLISVPKKRLKHAVDRNRVKRQVREAYRLQKQLLWQSLPADKSLAVAFIWLSDKLMDSQRVSRSVGFLLRRIAGKKQ